MRFLDRQDAGEKLAAELERFRGADVVVFGLPRGGVPVAAQVAKRLGAALDVVIARKLGHPLNREYAIGAVTDDGECLLNPEEPVDQEWLARAVARESEEARRRRAEYTGLHELRDLHGKTAIIVDDGIATGFTVRAAVASLRKRGPARVVVATPVAPPHAVELLRQDADEVVVLSTPTHLVAIGAAYDDFAPVTDAAVKALLRS
jgi:predicted phosphoribosyltransferase